MAGKYSLTLQLQLQSPKNVAQVVSSLQKQLGGVSVNVQVKNGKQAVQQVQQITAATNDAKTAAEKMGDAFGVSLKRFASFSLASRAIGVFTRGLARAIDESVEFDRQLNRIKQVTRASATELGSLSKEISRLAKTFGVASSEITETALILAQAGLNATDTRIALEALTKTRISATFGDINETAEGAVALLAQFGEGAAALERQLSAVNIVSAQFAVESEDLIEVIRRTGGVFRASGGSLEELLGLFTSVRATTREGAETIATALKTIFTRIQRPQTIQYLKDLGVELVNAEGAFVGPFEAIKRLSAAFGGLEQGSLKFIQIAEELGGFRQIGKVIPLLQQFAVAERARQAALEGGNSLTEEAAIAQESLAIQFQKVREEFLALIKSTTQTESFKVLTKTVLSIASALIKVADAIKPLLPLLTAFAAIKFAGNIGSFFGSIGASLQRRQFGGKIHKFASGGIVPGSGNRDTVPAMLTPGEFVIRKSSVQKLGAENLAAMNTGGEVQRFNTGRRVSSVGKRARRVTNIFERQRAKKGEFKETTLGYGKGDKRKVYGSLTAGDLPSGITTIKEYGVAFLSPQGLKQDLNGYIDLSQLPKKKKQGMPPESLKKIGIKYHVGSLTQGVSKEIETVINEGIIGSIDRGASYLAKIAGMKTTRKSGEALAKSLKNINIDNITGNIFEGIITQAAGAPYEPESADRKKANATFDYPQGLGANLAGVFGNPNLATAITDAKTRYSTKNINSLLKKAESDILKSFNKTPDLSPYIPAPKSKYTKEDVLGAFGNTAVSFRSLKNQFPGITQAELDSFGLIRKTPTGQAYLKRFFGGAIQKFAVGSKGKGVKPLKSRKAYVFDFDDTLAETEARVGAEPNNPDKFSQFRGDIAAKLIDSGQATQIAAMARKRAQLGHDIYVLTARPGEPQTVDAINRFMQRVGAPAKGVIGVGNMFAGEREPGKRPGTTRLLTTGSKKAKILSQIAPNYDTTWFLDDAVENLISGKQVAGVKTALADTKGKNIVKRFAKGGAASDTVPALLTPGEFVVNKKAAQRIGYGNLNRMNKQGVAGFAKGGPVAVKKFATGGTATGGGDSVSTKILAFTTTIPLITSVISNFGDQTTEAGKKINTYSNIISTGAISFAVAYGAVSTFAKKISEAGDKIEKQSQKRQDLEKKIADKEKQQQEKVNNARKEVEQLKKSSGTSYKAKEGAFAAVSNAKTANQTQMIAEENRRKQLLSERSSKKQDLYLSNNFGIGGDKSKIPTLEKEISLLDNEIKKSLSTSAKLTDAQKTLSRQQQQLANIASKTADDSRKLKLATEQLKKSEERLANTRSRSASFKANFGGIGSRVKDTFGGIAQSIGKASGVISVFTGAVFAVTSAINTYKQSVLDAAKIEEEQALKNVKSVDDIANVQKKLQERRAAERSLEKSGSAGTAASIGAAVGGIGGAIFGGPFGAAIGAAAGGAIGYSLGPWFAELIGLQQDQNKFDEETNRQNLDATLQASQKASENILKDQAKNFNTSGSAAILKDTEALARSFKLTTDASKKAGVNEEQRKAITDQQIETSGNYVRTLVGLGVAGEELNGVINKLTDGSSVSAEELKKVAKAALDQRAAMLAVTKANIDGLKISSTFAAGTLALDNFIDKFENGASDLSIAIRSTEASLENMAMGDQGIAALDTLRQQTLSALGSTGGEVTDALIRSFDSAKIAARFTDEATKFVAGADLTIDTDKQKDELAAGLSGLIPSDAPKEIREQFNSLIESTVRNAEPGKATEQVLKDLLQGFKPLSEAALNAAKTIDENNQKLKALSEKRKQIELAFIDAQKRTIDLQIEAAKIREEFGGQKVTPEQEFSARVRQFNIGGQAAGIGGLRTGSAEEIISAGARITSEFNRQQNTASKQGSAALGDNDKRDQLKKANEDLINLTRQRIEQTKQELDIIRKKNELEKSAIDKLLSGDVEGYQQASSAAAAASLLRSGYSGGLLGAFSNQALGEGAKSLEGQLSPQDFAAALGPVLARFGVQDSRSAQVFAGATAEEQRLLQRGQSEAGALEALGLGAEKIAQIELKSATMRIEQAKIELTSANQAAALAINKASESGDNSKKELADKAKQNAAGFNRGGIVYASRGRFIPRGTDTVPAMLTPGEFVVRREAVQAGNNLQILRAMNNGISNGGVLSNGVQGLAAGGTVQNITNNNNNIDVAQFSEAVGKLEQAISQIPREFFHQFNGSTNMSVTGLAGLTDVMKNIASDAIMQMAPKLKTDTTGNTQINNSVLG